MTAQLEVDARRARDRAHRPGPLRTLPPAWPRPATAPRRESAAALEVRTWTGAHYELSARGIALPVDYPPDAAAALLERLERGDHARTLGPRPAARAVPAEVASTGGAGDGLYEATCTCTGTGACSCTWNYTTTHPALARARELARTVGRALSGAEAADQGARRALDVVDAEAAR